MGQLKAKNERDQQVYEDKIEGLHGELNRVQKANRDLLQRQEQMEQHQQALEDEL